MRPFRVVVRDQVAAWPRPALASRSNDICQPLRLTGAHRHLRLRPLSRTQDRNFSQRTFPPCRFRRPRPEELTRCLLSMPRNGPASRPFSFSSALRHGDLPAPRPGEERRVTFIDKEGRERKFEVADGVNLLDIALSDEIEGVEGACGGGCACSTCHVIIEDPDMYDKMEEPGDDENDMLDNAFGLTETSRLGCQVKMNAGLDGLVVKVPSATRNMQASDFAKKQDEPGSASPEAS